MRSKITFLLLFSIVLTLFSQNKTIINFTNTDDLITVNYSITDNNNSIVNKTSYYYKNIKNEKDLKLAIENNYFFEKNFHVKNKKGKKTIEVKNRMFNNAMLNILFAEEVSSYIGNSKDLSLKKSYAVISTADKTLFLGKSFVFGRQKETQKLTHLFTAGIKAKLNEEFASFFNRKDKNLENEIGLNFKYTNIGNGIINFTNFSNELNNLNEKVIIPGLSQKTETNVKNNIYIDELKYYENIYGINSNKYKNKLKKYYKEKYEELYLELAKNELLAIKKEKLYNFIWDYYFTVEFFAPLSRSFYNVVPEITANLTNKDFNKTGFYPWKINLGYTNFWKTSSQKTIYLSSFFSLFNNNNIETSNLKSKTLQAFNSNNTNVLENTTSFHHGNYKRFTTGNIKLEAISYFIKKGTLGISAAIEKNIGRNYNALNWKLGIPISLKDKEGKPTVNFELQWKEVNNDRFLGIGVGFAFGKFIK